LHRKCKRINKKNGREIKESKSKQKVTVLEVETCADFREGSMESRRQHRKLFIAEELDRSLVKEKDNFRNFGFKI